MAIKGLNGGRKSPWKHPALGTAQASLCEPGQGGFGVLYPNRGGQPEHVKRVNYRTYATGLIGLCTINVKH